MGYVKPKKRFGQHYLQDDNILLEIIDVFKEGHRSEFVLEIGPGMGALTRFLLEEYRECLTLIELDKRCAEWLTNHFDGMKERLIQGDILRLDLADVLKGQTSVIGNFPFNISSQIVFKILENREYIPFVTGMFQKEVAQRLAAGPGGRVYGVISVLAQLYYDIEVKFHIPPEKFDPPPKVMSSVLVMHRHDRQYPVDDRAFRSVVKAAFSMRRKKLKNAMAGMLGERILPAEFSDRRAEELSLEEFIRLTNWLGHHE
jgi:16S rRNA (adenine1518-N6/adenine1519-N6)-dimethyltransferase